MTAIIYNFDRSAESDSADESERLFSALGRYTIAELLELLYVGEEPGFFELMRGIFGLSEQSRLILQIFLRPRPPRKQLWRSIERAGVSLLMGLPSRKIHSRDCALFNVT